MISIFAKPSYIGNLYPKHTKEANTHRLSSRIRGEEIAEYAGYKLNPKSGYENDTCVWVKPTGFSHIKDGHWVDVLDGLRKDRHELLKDRPGIKIIAGSLKSYKYLKKNFPNAVTCIPHQHLNWDRLKRRKRVVNTCGYIGSPSPYAFKHYEEIGKEIRKLGMKWVTCFDYKSRQDAVDFYMKIDILVVGAWDLGDRKPIFKMPTKIINAMSFGIPSIAFPMGGYEEIEGLYTRANNMDELLAGVQRLDSKGHYKEISKKLIEKANAYHIERIAGLYKKL